MKRNFSKLCIILALVMLFSAIPCRAAESGGSIASLSVEQICNAVKDYYAKVKPTAKLVAFPSEAMKKDYGYILILRSQAGNMANTLYCGLKVYLDTGKVEEDNGGFWYIKLPGATSSLKAVNRAAGIKLTWKKVSGATGYYIYRGKTKIATIKSGSTVTFTDQGTLTNGAKYTYKVYARNAVGRSTKYRKVTVYRLSTPTVSAVKSKASGKMTVSWKKNAKSSGYQVQYSLKKDFSTNKKVTVRGNSVITKTISKLTGGKTYYVRIRTFKTVNGKNYYSGWSAAKQIIVRK